MKKCIGIIGKLCSGKTTIADFLKVSYSIPIVSFGAYIAQYSAERNLPTDREALQNLGTKFINDDPIKLLNDVIQNSNAVNENICIIEGIRHKVIFDAIRTTFSDSLMVYCDVPDEVRFARYFERNKASDKEKNRQSFDLADNHIVESQISSLMEHCDIILANALPGSIELILEDVKKFIIGD